MVCICLEGKEYYTFAAEYVVSNGRAIRSDLDDRLTITPPPLYVWTIKREHIITRGGKESDQHPTALCRHPLKSTKVNLQCNTAQKLYCTYQSTNLQLGTIATCGHAPS